MFGYEENFLLICKKMDGYDDKRCFDYHSEACWQSGPK